MLGPAAPAEYLKNKEIPMQRLSRNLMQRRSAGCIALCLGLCAAPAISTAAANLDLSVSNQPVYGYLLGNYAFVDSAWNADDYGLGAQIGIGVPILDWLSVEGSYSYNTIGGGAGSDIKQNAWGVDFVGQFGDRETPTPYLLFGGGVVRNDVTPSSLNDTSPFFSIGAGIVGPLQTRWLRYRVESRLIHNDYLDDRTDFRLGLGLEVVLGDFPPEPAPPPPPPPPPVERIVEVPVPVPVPDSDGDGVPDSHDRCPDTLPGVKVDGFGCAIQAPQTVELRDVTFEFNSSALTANGRTVLEPAVKFLLNQPQLKAQIAGHTDSVGSDAYNLKLSRQRAESVRSYLVSRGVSAAQLTAVGYGESRPVASNQTDEGRARNRRVELNIEGVNAP
jgi:OmpA-OmpF porin, OOP family